MLTYATAVELAAEPWLVTTPPANVGRYLLQASLLVRQHTLTALYATDADGYPSLTAARQGFRDATCAQVTAWIAAGIDPTGAGAGQSTVVASKKLGPREIQFATYERDAKQRAYITTHLVDTAVQILADLGLCDGVQVTG